MKRTAHLLAMFALLAPAASASAQLAPQRFETTVAQDTGRARAIEYSDAYATRLTIHRIGSYAVLPLFAAQYYLGDRLINGGDVPGWVKPAHGVAAGAIGALFAVNTVTGIWNLYDSRKDPSGRARRYLHTALMLSADAGFAYTGLVTAGEASEGDDDDSNTHRNAALVSIGLATAGTLMMWLWKD
jgi:hypothetical protein